MPQVQQIQTQNPKAILGRGIAQATNTLASGMAQSADRKERRAERKSASDEAFMFNLTRLGSYSPQAAASIAKQRYGDEEYKAKYKPVLDAAAMDAAAGAAAEAEKKRKKIDGPEQVRRWLENAKNDATDELGSVSYDYKVKAKENWHDTSYRIALAMTNGDTSEAALGGALNKLDREAMVNGLFNANELSDDYGDRIRKGNANPVSQVELDDPTAVPSAEVLEAYPGPGSNINDMMMAAGGGQGVNQAIDGNVSPQGQAVAPAQPQSGPAPTSPPPGVPVGMLPDFSGGNEATSVPGATPISTMEQGVQGAIEQKAKRYTEMVLQDARFKPFHAQIAAAREGELLTYTEIMNILAEKEPAVYQQMMETPLPIQQAQPQPGFDPTANMPRGISHRTF